MVMEEGTTIFEPGEEELKKEYKELGDIPEFDGLSDKEVRLCWYVGCASSPLIPLDYADRIHKVLMMLEFPDAEAAKYAKGKMPDKVKAGIERMKSFNPDARMAGRFALELAFANITSIIALSKNELTAMDMGARKQYVELAVKATAEIPSMIERMEAGFGVKKSSERGKQSGKRPSLADDVVNTL